MCAYPEWSYFVSAHGFQLISIHLMTLCQAVPGWAPQGEPRCCF
jgi:hypothetical protein